MVGPDGYPFINYFIKLLPAHKYKCWFFFYSKYMKLEHEFTFNSSEI
jgi:hypothetical protein